MQVEDEAEWMTLKDAQCSFELCFDKLFGVDVGEILLEAEAFSASEAGFPYWVST